MLDFAVKCVRYPYLGDKQAPLINLALLGTCAGHYRVIQFEEETPIELLYQHFIDTDNVMNYIGSTSGIY